MNLEFATALKNRKISFNYKGEARQILVREAKHCKNGATIVKGIDLMAEAKALSMHEDIGNENDFTKSFRINQIQDLTIIQ